MRSGFFNSNIEDYDEYGNPIYDRAEEASFFAEFFASFIGNGVYPNPSTGMQVLANNGMNLKIQPGKCFINGYFGLVEEGGEIITIESADANYSRIDRVVARWDLELRKIIPYVLKGTPASKPLAPSLTRNSNIYEIALADVSVKANATTITQANITDRRLDTSLCGVVSGIIEQVDTTTLFNQYLTWFEEKKQESADNYQEWFDGFTGPSEEQFTEWFNGMKDQLSEDAAGNLQLQVNELKENGIVVSPTEPQTDRRKVWFQKGKNLFNKEDILEGYHIDNEGVAVTSEGTFCSNFIEVVGGNNIVKTVQSSWNGFGMYDANKNFIELAAANTYLLPENCKYIRINGLVENLDIMQIEYNTEPTEYESYINPTIYTRNDKNIYEKFIKNTERNMITASVSEEYAFSTTESFEEITIPFNIYSKVGGKLKLSKNGILIGKGVSKIAVECCGVLGDGLTSTCYILIRNNRTSSTLRQVIKPSTTTGSDSAYYTFSLSRQLLDVKEYDWITCSIMFASPQNNKKIIAGTTWMTVEVLE